DRHLVEIVGGDGCHGGSSVSGVRVQRVASAMATPRGPTSASLPLPASAMPVSGNGFLTVTFCQVLPPSALATMRPPASAGRASPLPVVFPLTPAALGPVSPLFHDFPASSLR